MKSKLTKEDMADLVIWLRTIYEDAEDILGDDNLFGVANQKASHIIVYVNTALQRLKSLERK